METVQIVYVLWDMNANDYSGIRDLKGIFATRELAQKAVPERYQAYKVEATGNYVDNYTHYAIEEVYVQYEGV